MGALLALSNVSTHFSDLIFRSRNQEISGELVMVDRTTVSGHTLMMSVM